MDAMDAIFWMTEAGWSEEIAVDNVFAEEERGEILEEAEESSEEVVEERVSLESEVPVSFVYCMQATTITYLC